MSQAPQDIQSLIDALESIVFDAKSGLPEELFLLVTRLTPMINVDLLIRDNKGRTLLTWRDDGYEYSPGWHIPGGIIRYKETRAERIQAVALKELSAHVCFQEEPLAIREVIHPLRENRGHFISLLYLCELLSPLDETQRFMGKDPSPGQWAWHSGCPEDLIPVHEMYRPFLEGALPFPIPKWE